jgi:hypothetical protein
MNYPLQRRAQPHVLSDYAQMHLEMCIQLLSQPLNLANQRIRTVVHGELVI